jgi:hypothetical protein
MLTPQNTRTQQTINYGMRNYVQLLGGFRATHSELLFYNMRIIIDGNKI